MTITSGGSIFTIPSLISTASNAIDTTPPAPHYGARITDSTTSDPFATQLHSGDVSRSSGSSGSTLSGGSLETSVPLTGTGSGRNKKLSAGAIGGIVGGLLFLAILVGFAVMRKWYAKKREKRLHGWASGFKWGRDEKGIEGGPQVEKRARWKSVNGRDRPLSDDSFGTPEPTLGALSWGPLPLPSQSSGLRSQVAEDSAERSNPSLDTEVTFTPGSASFPSIQVPESTRSAIAASPPMRAKRQTGLTLRPSSLFPFAQGADTLSVNSASRDPFADSSAGGVSASRSDVPITRYPVSPLSGHFVDLVPFPTPPATKSVTFQSSIPSLPIPENGSFELPYDGFLEAPSMTHLGMSSHFEDPFADSPNFVLSFPSPIRSTFSNINESDSPESRRTSVSSNMTRVARSWNPSAPEELSVSAGDIVRVISRHAGESGGRNSGGGGWALVKRFDSVSGIGKRGFVPVNCLMDVQGPPAPSSE